MNAFLARLLRTLYGTALAATLGCASVIGGTSQSITINTNVIGAEVFVDGKKVGTAPLTTRIERNDTTVVMVQKDGYTPQRYDLDTSVSGWFWLNILWGTFGLFSSTTDWISGAMYEYSPNSFFVTLVPVGQEEYDTRREQEDRLLHYCLTNFGRIADDLLKGDGEYLQGLYDLSGLSTSSLTELRRLQRDVEDLPAFALTVADMARRMP